VRAVDLVKTSLFFGALVAVALFFILRTLGQYRERQRKFQQWPKATGTVVRYERESGGRYNVGGVVCVYRYELNGGHATGHGPNISQGTSSPPSLSPGATVQIAYNPNDFDEVMTERDARRPPALVGQLVLPVLVILATGGMLIATIVRRAAGH
jgi:hypothetical protein